ncbi:MAG: hypothetical protein QW483_01120, partial [Nanopusillaceae archaeon]
FPQSDDIRKHNAGFVLDLDLDLWAEKICEIKEEHSTLEYVFDNAVNLYMTFVRSITKSYELIFKLL